MDVHKPAYKKSVGFLRQLGLSAEQSNAYLYLLEHGPQTVLSLSRGLSSGRTKLYPLLDELTEKQLVTVHEQHYGTSYEAKNPDAIRSLVQEQELTTRQLNDALPHALETLHEIAFAAPTTSKILEYQGIDGFKQVQWNMANADTDITQLVRPGLQKKIDPPFRKKIAQALHSKQVRSLSEIDPDLFTIECETYIYNNVVALIDDDLNGIEIYNIQLARQYQQLFNLLWKLHHR